MNRPNRGRRKRDEPFNPFAKNAIQERNRRQAERAKEQRLKDNLASQTSKPENNNAAAKHRSLEEMRKAAQQKLSNDKIIDQKLSTEVESKPELPTPDPEPVITRVMLNYTIIFKIKSTILMFLFQEINQKKMLEKKILKQFLID